MQVYSAVRWMCHFWVIFPFKTEIRLHDDDLGYIIFDGIYVLFQFVCTLMNINHGFITVNAV